MLGDEEPIPQSEIEQLDAVERYFSEILEYYRRQLQRGRQIEPGKLTVNLPALLVPFPRVIITEGQRVRSIGRPQIPADGFGGLRRLLSDLEVEELRRKGQHKIARQRRATNRRMYRGLVRVYVNYMREVFQYELAAYVQSGQEKKVYEILADAIKLRYYAAQLSFAATAHFLRFPNPCALVTKGMRGTAFVINQLAVIPPSWQ